jgi:hypothetical protein
VRSPAPLRSGHDPKHIARAERGYFAVTNRRLLHDPGYEASDRVRCEHSSGVGAGGDPRGNVHGDAANVSLSALLALTRVHSRSDIQAEFLRRARELDTALERCVRRRERGQRAIAR